MEISISSLVFFYIINHLGLFFPFIGIVLVFRIKGFGLNSMEISKFFIMLEEEIPFGEF